MRFPVNRLKGYVTDRERPLNYPSLLPIFIAIAARDQVLCNSGHGIFIAGPAMLQSSVIQAEGYYPRLKIKLKVKNNGRLWGVDPADNHSRRTSSAILDRLCDDVRVS
jgi:hypothetical protein